jgi:ATP-dependent Zn protease
MPAKPKAKPVRDKRKISKRGPLRGYEIETTAYHEAGHVAAALATGATVQTATIKPRGDLLGQVRYGPRRIDDESQLVNTLAGPFAQKRFAPRSDWRTGNRDFVKVKNEVSRTRGKDTVARKYLAYVEARAAQVVDDLWADITVLAKALLERETLTGREIRAVIRKAST